MNQNLTPDGNHLWSTYFVDDNTGWIIGSEGLIKKTTNGGIDWVEQQSGTVFSLRSVQFITPNIGWICGENGIIIKTSDGGQNWFEQVSGTAELLTDLQFLDQNIGYIVGTDESILTTTDGGLNWTSQHSGSTYDLYSIDFVSKDLGYAVGGRNSTKFLKTTDGGLNWIEKPFPNGFWSIPKILNCVDFIDANSGWVGFGTDQFIYGKINKTTDGGETWVSTTLNTPGNKSESTNNNHESDSFADTQNGIREIFFLDSINGYAVGGSLDGWRRSIFYTNDAGLTWQPKYSYSEQTGLVSIHLNNSGQGWAVGYYGVIYKTVNNGASWTQVLSGINSGYTGDWITSIFMISDSVGWAAGYRKGIWYYPIILKTTTGGKIWETNSEFNDSFVETDANIFFLNENIGWVNFYDDASYKTTDGGANWFPNSNPGNQKFFFNQDTGLGTYEPLGIFKSTDGGSIWIQKSSVNTRSIFFADLNNGWAVGSNGNIVNSCDQGESWILQTSGTSSDLNSVNFYNNNTGVCVGNAGTVLLTTDGGSNWVSQNVGTNVELKSVVFSQSNSLWISGSDGIILHSSDLGNSWTSFTGLTTNNLFTTFFINENLGWFGGSNGTILKYQDYPLPVELISFNASLKNKIVELNWQTATETNNLGFEIERKTADQNWQKLGFVEGHINSTTPISYSFIDQNLNGQNKYQYRLKQIDLDGSFIYSNLVEIEIMPEQFELFQNYPNPFNPSTTISFSIPDESYIKLELFNMIGEQVVTLADGVYKAGYHQIELNAGDLATGTYVYRMASNNIVQFRKMVLLK